MKLLIPYVKFGFKRVEIGAAKPKPPLSPKNPKSAKPGWSRRKRAMVPAVIILVLAGAALLSIRLLSSPAVGSITENGPQMAAAAVSIGQPKYYSDSYISFNYPANFKQIPAAKAPGYLDVINLSSTDRSNEYLAITIVRESLDNDPSLNHRRLHPETYKPAGGDPTNNTFISTASGYEKTGYLAHSGLVLAISLTSSFKNDAGKDYDAVAASLQWK